MSALTGPRAMRRETWQYQVFRLGDGKIAYENGIAAFDQSAGVVIPGEAQSDLFALGTFAETVDNSMPTTPPRFVNVKLKREVNVVFFANDDANPVTANDIGKDAFIVDDQTVSISSATGTRSVLGTIWAVDAVAGVAVEMR